ncbi:MAG: hypothetical protein JO275_05550 [Verrucomicrobia bacterium]|nr:hypothetical protein [Verrucomicrobiota bacterium]
MKNIPQIALLSTLLLSSCTEISSVLVPPAPRQYGTNDYAVGEAQPYPQEVILAKKRLANFIHRAGRKQRQVLDQNPYVAVQASELLAGEVWPLLRELSSGRVKTMQYVQDLQNQPNYWVKFLLLFDGRTQRLLRSDGVLIMDEPQRGSVVDFAGTKAIYAGTGWW